MSEEVKEYPLDEERAKKAYDALVKYLALSARSEKECKENCLNYPDDQWLKDIIMVLLLNEMYVRRRRKRFY